MIRFQSCLLLGLLVTIVGCSSDSTGESGAQLDATANDASIADVGEDRARQADRTGNDAVGDGTVADSTEPTTLGDADASVTIPDLGLGDDTSEQPDATPDPSIIDRGELPYDVRVEDSVSDTDAGHRYMVYAVSGMEASIAIEAGGTFGGGATFEGPLVDGSTDTTIASVDLNSSSSETMSIEVETDGFYWLTITG